MAQNILPKNKLTFLPLGGSNEIGINCNLYGYGGSFIMVDLGIMFHDGLGVDILMPDLKIAEDLGDNLKALVVTHAHEDHIGAIPYVWMRLQCPIYATPFTAYLVRQKLKDVGLLEYANIVEVKPGVPFEIEGFEITYVEITHSIPEASLIKIKTPVGTVVHTGDWKLDANPLLGADTDVARIQEMGREGVDALICDSTNIFQPGRSGSEADVRKSLSTLISQQPNRVVVTCFASNVARLQTCAEIAHAQGRKMALAGRSLFRMETAARESGYLKNIPAFVSPEELMKLPRHEALLLTTGSQGESRAGLWRMSLDTHPEVRLTPGDTVIFSSRVIPGNETVIHMLQENLMEQGLIVISDGETETHVSGHPAQEELKDMYTWIKPRTLIPVHGERPHIRAHAKFGLECGIPFAIGSRNGQAIALAPGEPEILKQFPTGRLALDGTAVMPFQDAMMKERIQLSDAGLVVVQAPFDRAGRLINMPTVQLYGVCQQLEVKPMMEDIGDAVADRLAHLSEKQRQTHEPLEDAIRKAARSVVKAARGKKPMVCVLITRV